MRPRTDPAPLLAAGRRRLRVVGVAFGLAFASIGLRLVDMVEWGGAGGAGGEDGAAAAVVGGGVLTGTANAALPPAAFLAGAGAYSATARAEITDRNGILLATNLRVPSLHIDPSVVADKDAVAARLAAVLDGVDAAALARRMRVSGRREVPVKHQVTPAEQARVLELGVPGIGFESSLHRVYPKQGLTSHVLGYVDIDNRGLAGVERFLDERLSPGGGAARGPVALSLDLRVQQVVREELLAAYQRFRAKGAAAVVLDTRSGEVLAMVSLPDFDPNRPGGATDEQRLNRVTGGTYELGSLFKIFTAGLALDSGRISMADRFDATQPLKIGRFTIRDDHAKKRWLTVPECFIHSSNICTAKMAFASGGELAVQEFFKRLGFYEKPDIELPQLELGRPQAPKRWAEVTTATVSFGHGIAVSPFQFADAMSGLLGSGEGGHWSRPTLLARRPGLAGAAGPAAPSPRAAPVGPGVAEDLRWLLWLTVEKGTGTEAKGPAYLVGGKTGTADKPAEQGQGRGYRKGAVLASFVGAFPIERPRYLVLAVLDEPQGDKGTHGYRYGGWTAAPVVGAVVDRIGPLLGVRPSDEAAGRAFEGRLVTTKVAGEREERLAAAGGPAR